MAPHSYRCYYAVWFVVGCMVGLWSALMDPNPIAFIAGLLIGGGAVAFDRTKRIGATPSRSTDGSPGRERP